METVTYVLGFVLETAWRFAPVFALSIGLAAVLRSLPVAQVASRWLARRERAAVLGGSALGAFSPFCSCTVIPVVRSLLVAGAPLAGVMAFWVASPLMDPEIFLFTVGLLGWDLAVARLVAALALSLLAGVGAVLAVRRGWLPASLSPASSDAASDEAVATVVRAAPRRTRDLLLVGDGVGERPLPVVGVVELDRDRGGAAVATPTDDGCCGAPASTGPAPTDDGGCDVPTPAASGADGCCDVATPAASGADGCCDVPTTTGLGVVASLRSLDWRVVGRDFRDEAWNIGRWLLLAFAIEALILRFVPQEALVGVLGQDAPWAVPLAALLGVPLYLDNLSALPVIAGLLEQGMSPGAAIAFLLAGPVTTIPAMTAVRAIMPGAVFRYYLVVSIGGSMLLGALAGLVL